MFAAPLAGLALSAGGALAQNASVNKQEKAREQALQQERQRQAAFSADSFKAFDKGKAGLTRGAQDQALADTTAARDAALQGSLDTGVPGSNEYQPIAGEVSDVANKEIARKLSQALAEGRTTATNLARIGAYGDNQFNNKVALNNAGQTIGMNGDFSRGSSAVLPLELQAAQRKGQGIAGIGDLLSAFGQLSGQAGATGFGSDWFGPSLAARGPGPFLAPGVR